MEVDVSECKFFEARNQRSNKTYMSKWKIENQKRKMERGYEKESFGVST